MVAAIEQIISPYYQTDRFSLYEGDCRIVLPTLAENSVDSIVCDPPYELGFMGKGWDRSGIAYDVNVWHECLRVLKPGGHLLAFGGSRTYHRLACAIEDAGFEIRDDIDFWYDANPVFAEFYNSLNDEQKSLLHRSAGASHLSWLYGSGFPKSLDVSKAIDAAAGVEREVVGSNNYTSRRPLAAGKDGVFDNKGPNLGGPRSCDVSIPTSDAAKQWNGWGTALKPAHEPIVLARKPLIGTVAENVLQHGTGGLNIDGCRIEGQPRNPEFRNPKSGGIWGSGDNGSLVGYESPAGRWPSNLIHDGSEEVLAGFPDAPGQLRDQCFDSSERARQNVYGPMKRGLSEASADRTYANKGSTDFAVKPGARRLDSGSAARFFYCAKSSQDDRNEGLEDLPIHSAGEVTDRKDGSAGLNSPRAGAGRTNGSRNNHPTVKPTDLMRYLCRLVTPPGALVLDPFCGSGSTGKGAMLEGLRFIGIELSADYCELAQRRIEAVTRQGSLFV